MALRQLMLSKKIEQRKASLLELNQKEEALKTREAAAEQSAEEAKTEEEIKAVEAEADAIESAKKDLDEKKQGLESEIADLEGELEELNSKDPAKENRGKDNGGGTAGKVGTAMSRHKIFKNMTREALNEMLTREDVKSFLTNVRELGSQNRSVKMADLTIPESFLEMLRDTVSTNSKLLSKVNYKPLKGTARRNISGSIPEAVWTEMKGALNELELSFNQVEVDGYKVGGFIPIDNATLHDSDEDLSAEIITALGKAIAKALDKAILYGDGTKQPMGIVTRLAQTTEPNDYSEKAPKWVDLHITHVTKVSATGAALFGSIITAFANCKNDFSDGGKFFAMNSKTHAKLTVEMLNFNAAGALVSGMNNQMPVIGGEIVELDFISDNDIIGGYGDLYTLVEREGVTFASSDQVKFIEDMTVFKGSARYDGLPVIAEGFMVINVGNANAVTTKSFEFDYSNTELGTLSVVSAANATTSGKTDITIGGGEVSGTTFGYKIGGKAASVACGDDNTGYTAITSGSAIVAATGKVITVVEFDGNGRVIKVGSAQVIAKA